MRPTKEGSYEMFAPDGARIVAHIQRIVAVYSVNTLEVSEGFDGEASYIEYSGQAEYIDEDAEEMGDEIGEYGITCQERLFQAENGREWSESDIVFVPRIAEEEG